MPVMTFGARFLAEFRRLGGSTDDWPPRAVEAIERADRRAFAATLGRLPRPTGSALIVAAHTAEPETLARRLADQQREDAADWMILWIAGLAG